MKRQYAIVVLFLAFIAQVARMEWTSGNISAFMTGMFGGAVISSIVVHMCIRRWKKQNGE